MPTGTVELTRRQADLIESGRYQNVSEGLRLVEQREAEAASKLEALRAAARIGAGALDRASSSILRISRTWKPI
jgi:antitoxin ParD1/3/4